MPAVALVGVAMTPFGRHPDATIGDLASEAVRGALNDAGLEAADVDAVVFSNSFDGLMSGQESIRGEVALAGVGFAGKTMLNVENACASGLTAMYVAHTMIVAGKANRVLVVGAEKLFDEDRSRSFAALRSATDVSAYIDNGATRSVFMDHYAQKALEHMERYGSTPADFAAVAVKNSVNGSLNPLAHHRTVHDLESVLGSRVVTAPLTLFMCSPISDGAAAVLLSADAGADGEHPLLLGTGVAIGDGRLDPTSLAAERAFVAAGVNPRDVDVAEVHDATAPAEILAIETLGLVARGEGAAFTSAGETARDGSIAVNPSGGLLARGHPIGATGVAQVAEIVWQLRGDAGERQVAGASIGVTQNSGGVLGGEVAVAAVTVIRR